MTEYHKEFCGLADLVFLQKEGGAECVGFPFFGLAAARCLVEEQTATFEWPFGTIVVRGPKTLEFYEAFCSHRVTGAKADGKDIVSVTFRSLEADQSAES